MGWGTIGLQLMTPSEIKPNWGYNNKYIIVEEMNRWDKFSLDK